MDCSPPGSSIHGISLTKILLVVPQNVEHGITMLLLLLLLSRFSRVRLCATP